MLLCVIFPAHLYELSVTVLTLWVATFSTTVSSRILIVSQKTLYF